jgi:hypothetical protein
MLLVFKMAAGLLISYVAFAAFLVWLTNHLESRGFKNQPPAGFWWPSLGGGPSASVAVESALLRGRARALAAGLSLLILSACTYYPSFPYFDPSEPAQRAIGGAVIGAGTGAVIGVALGGWNGVVPGITLGGIVGALTAEATTTAPPPAPVYYPPSSYYLPPRP